MKAFRALGRLPVGSMNKTEQEYSALLETRKRLGEILWYEFEGVKLRLADNTFYTPDFVVMNALCEIEFHEVKGFWTDDARVKIKVAACKFPMFVFVAVNKLPKKDGGGWGREDF